MNYRQNYSLEGDLSPRNLESELKNTNTIDFLNSFAGRKSLLTILFALFDSMQQNTYREKAGSFTKGQPQEDEELAVFLEHVRAENLFAQKSLVDFAHDLLEFDYDNVPAPYSRDIETLLERGQFDMLGELRFGQQAPAPEDLDIKAAFLRFWKDAISGSSKAVPTEAEKRIELSGHKSFETFRDGSMWNNIKSKFNKFIDSWRGYSDKELQYSKADVAFRKLLTGKIPGFAKAFSNNGVKNMKVKRPVRKTFSNAQACDMLAHKLTNDWFICEPECQPLISEQLKAAQVPVASFAPALKCNVFQYDGEAAVSKSELAALDKVQQFVQALKDEIACGNDCGGIQMVPETKAFSLKRNLKKMLRNFAETGEIEMEEIATPNELIKAEEAGIDLDNPEMYEEVADKAEAGELPAELMAPMAPAVVAPTSIDEDSLGYAYNDLVDSTIADDEGITQEDMSGYDATPGELSLSAAPVGNAMAEAQADAIVWEDEDAAPMKPVAAAPIMAPAAPQNFSRSVRRQQKAAAQKKNFSAKQPAKPATRTISVRGLHRLLGDNYIK